PPRSRGRTVEKSYAPRDLAGTIWRRCFHSKPAVRPLRREVSDVGGFYTTANLASYPFDIPVWHRTCPYFPTNFTGEGWYAAQRKYAIAGAALTTLMCCAGGADALVVTQDTNG